MIWADTNGDQKPAAGKLSGSQAAQYVAKEKFAPGFERFYRNLVEQVRQDSVARELQYTFRNKIVTDLGATLKAMPKSLNMTDAEVALYKRGIAKLLEVAPKRQH